MIKVTEEIQSSLGALKESVRHSDIWKRFEKCREELLAHPELFEQMNRFRKDNYISATREPEKHIVDPEMWGMIKERSSVYANPVIANYLDAELRLCILMRHLYTELTELAELDLEEFEEVLSPF